MPTINEFHDLVSYENKIEQKKTIAQGERFNKIGQFNLLPTILPFDQNRIRLRKPIDGYDYINASWLNSAEEESTYEQVIYSKQTRFSQIKFAVGQNPLPNTIHHHYQMIHENRFDVVVSFSENENNKLGAGVGVKAEGTGGGRGLQFYSNI